MCGICGIISRNKNITSEHIVNMSKKIFHRGPDGKGYYIGNYKDHLFKRLNDILSTVEGNFFLAHRRLSIIDLSKEADQPMVDQNDDYILIFNGEIYNYKELRTELEKYGHVFKTNSDTEVLLNSYIHWKEKCVKKFDGMWSFVIYDKKRNILFGSRDITGVKPFYFFKDKEYFVFASEIKSILEVPFYKKKINKESVLKYFMQIEECNLFSGIDELSPATNFVFDLSDFSFKTWKYFSIETNISNESYDDKKTYYYSENVKKLFEKSVKSRLNSDVSVGSCLSGGIDSSAIVSLISEKYSNLSEISQKAFTAVFPGESFDETDFASEVIKKYKNIEWIKVFTEYDDLKEDLEDLVYTQDYPFFTTSIYAQYKVMKKASEEGIKVMLDGQGADELFGGYIDNYNLYLKDLFLGKHFKTFLKEKKKFEKCSFMTGELILKSRFFKFFLNKYIESVHCRLPYLKREYNQDMKKILLCKNQELFNTNSFNKNLEYSYFKKGLKYLLRYEDRNSMRFSIESRIPFADSRELMNFAFDIPFIFKIRNGYTKYIFRKAISGLVPKKILYRKDKIGFVTPEERWMFKLSKNFKEEFKDYRDEYIDLKDNDFIYDWKLINYITWRKKFNI